jgi:hypothetical protein
VFPLGDSAFPDTEKCLFHAAIRFSHLHSRNDDREFPFKIYLDFPQPSAKQKQAARFLRKLPSGLFHATSHVRSVLPDARFL